MNWLARLTAGTLTAGILLGTAIEPGKAAEFTFSQGNFFTVPIGDVPDDLQPMPVDAILTGQFAGSDINNDRVLELSELTFFSAFFEPASYSETLQDLISFSYNFNSGVLNFLSGENPINEARIIARDGSTVIDQKEGTAIGTRWFSEAPITVTAVSEPATVPEPTTLLGLSALAILGGASQGLRGCLKRVKRG